jgi:hypothetical protein
LSTVSQIGWEGNGFDDQRRQECQINGSEFKIGYLCLEKKVQRIQSSPAAASDIKVSTNNGGKQDKSSIHNRGCCSQHVNEVFRQRAALV